MNNLGKQIGDTVRSALQSGDLSKLSEIGPAVQNTVQNAMGNLTGSTGDNADSNTAQPVNDKQAPPPPPPPVARPHMPDNQKFNYQNAHPTPNAGSRVPTPVEPLRPVWMGKNGGVPTIKRGPSNFTGVGGMLVGGLSTFVFGVLSLVFGIIYLTGGASYAALLPISSILLTGVSILGMGASNSKRKLAGRVRTYYRLLAANNHCTLEELATAVNKSVDDVKKDLRKAQRKNMMPDVRMDDKQTCLMLGEETYQLYLESEKAREQRELEEAERALQLQDPAIAALEDFKQEGKDTQEQLGALRSSIESPVVTAKLEQIELTMNRIYSYVKAHPEKLPETRKLRTYYMPMLLKALRKYKQYEQMDIELSDVAATKQEVERIVDLSNTAFTNLLEKLYRAETLDVATDIEVLENMLRQEGLTGQNFEIEPRE